MEVAVLTLDFARTTPTARPGVALVQLHNELWRVTRPSGEVLGYIERFAEPEGTRYRAKRLLVQQRRFVIVGEFWGIDEALDCFSW
jgi:hypothetical protein